MDCANQTCSTHQPLNVAALKKKIIKEIDLVFRHLMVGKPVEYADILNEISLVDLIENFDIKSDSLKFAEQYYLNKL